VDQNHPIKLNKAFSRRKTAVSILLVVCKFVPFKRKNPSSQRQRGEIGIIGTFRSEEEYEIEHKYGTTFETKCTYFRLSSPIPTSFLERLSLSSFVISKKE